MEIQNQPNKPPLPFDYTLPGRYQESRYAHSTIYGPHGIARERLLLRCANLGNEGLLPNGVIQTLDGYDEFYIPIFSPDQKDSLLEEITYLQLPSELFNIDYPDHGEASELARSMQVVSETGAKVGAKIIWFINHIQDPGIKERTQNNIKDVFKIRLDPNHYPTPHLTSPLLPYYQHDLTAFNFMTDFYTRTEGEQEIILRREKVLFDMGAKSPGLKWYNEIKWLTP